MLRYKVIILKRFYKHAKKIPSKLRAKILESIIEILSENPYAGKRLREPFTGVFSLRIGDYRILYKNLREGESDQIN